MKTEENTPTYPIVAPPTQGADVTLPQPGRSDLHGYSDHLLVDALRGSELGDLLRCDVSLPVPYRTRPYEPAIALVDEMSGLLIDVEIDAPYDGYYRIPTHHIGADDTRNLYFSEHGWTVVRFTEHQVRAHTKECVGFLQSIVKHISDKEQTPFPFPENAWDIRKAIAWERELYREKYLRIQTFDRKDQLEQLIGDIHESFSHKGKATDEDIVFNEETHTYSPAANQTGAADYISVTSLIEKFFPMFDEEAYIQRYMAESGKSREEVIRKMLEPSERGTDMHQQIEYFLKGKDHREDFKEFQLFKDFYTNEILKRGLSFYDAEKVVTLPQYGIAGTVDALFRKPNGDFVMVDWKRSKKLILDGYPKKYGMGHGLSILAHLDNSSYYHYELQQSFYKYILENEYGMKISSMILAVLHPDYDRYYKIKLSTYRVDEVEEMIAALFSFRQ